jgi:hypothetical protein
MRDFQGRYEVLTATLSRSITQMRTLLDSISVSRDLQQLYLGQGLTAKAADQAEEIYKEIGMVPALSVAASTIEQILLVQYISLQDQVSDEIQFAQKPPHGHQ